MLWERVIPRKKIPHVVLVPEAVKHGLLSLSLCAWMVLQPFSLVFRGKKKYSLIPASGLCYTHDPPHCQRWVIYIEVRSEITGRNVESQSFFLHPTQEEPL